MGHSFPDADAGMTNFACLWCRTYLYTFHMALFFFLSGFVSSRRLLAGNYVVAAETKKRALRLLVPYFLYSMATLLPKLLFSQFARHPFETNQVVYLFLGKSPNGGVWFLWTLFVISVLYLALGKVLARNRHKTVILLLVGTVLYLIWVLELMPDNENLIVIGYVLKFSVFYALGIFMAEHYGNVKGCFNSVIAVICIIVGILIANPDTWNDKFYLLTAMLGMYAFYALAYKLSFKDSGIKKVFDSLGTYSYDIYLLCYFVQIPIRIICYQVLGMWYWLVVFLMFSCSIIIPYFITTRLIRGNKWLERLLVGKWN